MTSLNNSETQTALFSRGTAVAPTFTLKSHVLKVGEGLARLRIHENKVGSEMLYFNKGILVHFLHI